MKNTLLLLLILSFGIGAGLLIMRWYQDQQIEKEKSLPQVEKYQNKIEKEQSFSQPEEYSNQKVTKNKQIKIPGNVIVDRLDIGGIAPSMVWIPSGKLIIGKGDNERTVSIEGFWMSRYEITVDEYNIFAQATWREKPKETEGGNDPVTSVSWLDARAYVQWLSQQTGESYRLPIETEWEYADRDSDVISFNGKFDTILNLFRFINTVKAAALLTDIRAVGSGMANVFNLYDISGNAYEWIQDCWDSNISNKNIDYDLNICEFRVIKSKSKSYSWDLFESQAKRYSRDLYYGKVNMKSYAVGFRITRD